MISETALLELIRETLETGDPDGLTSADIANITGKDVQSTRMLIGQLMKQGKMEFAGKGKRRAIDGSMRSVPLYRVTEKLV